MLTNICDWIQGSCPEKIKTNYFRNRNFTNEPVSAAVGNDSAKFSM